MSVANIFGAVLLAVTVFVTGLWHGGVTNRWGPQPNVVAAGKRLSKISTDIGEWRMVADEELRISIAEVLQCEGYINRKYENLRTGTLIHVFVILGPAGPIAVHTPEVCYPSRDFVIESPRKPIQVQCSDGVVDELWDLRLKRKKQPEASLRSLYAWTNDAHWRAAKSPRFTYGARPFLYKVQLTGPAPTTEQGDPCTEFLAEFLPELRKYMLSAND
jgi:hypothetical protein